MNPWLSFHLLLRESGLLLTVICVGSVFIVSLISASGREEGSSPLKDMINDSSKGHSSAQLGDEIQTSLFPSSLVFLVSLSNQSQGRTESKLQK